MHSSSIGLLIPFAIMKNCIVSLENKVVVEGMEMIISAGTVTHDSAFTGSEGGRDSKNWGGVSEKMEKQSWYFFSNPDIEPALHARVVWFIKATVLLIFLGKWVTGMALVFVS